MLRRILTRGPAWSWAPQYRDESNTNELRSVVQTADEGFILSGWTDLYNTDNTDMWIVKLSPSFAIEWERLIDWGYQDRAYAVKEITGGKYIAAGSRFDNESGNDEFMIVMLDEDGGITQVETLLDTENWERTYSGLEGSNDVIMDIEQTYDGGFIFTGNTLSLNGNDHIWIMKLNSDGEIPVDYREVSKKEE